MVLLAHTWDGIVDVTGYWMSEKLDGVRAYWNGEDFLTRNGNVITAPAWFKAPLPRRPLDGELWCGRKQFQRCVSIVRTNWEEVTFVAFDAPDAGNPFEVRLSNIPIEFRLPQIKCESNDHAWAYLRQVEAHGGEGIMLRQPGSPYVNGRNKTLLKMKSFLDDEATVIAYTDGKGKHGELVVERADGCVFKVGVHRAQPPALGTKITFRYQTLTKDGVPRFPTFVGEAFDK